jgi:hypothetical protein
MKRCLLWILLTLLAPPVFAHSASTSYLAIEPATGREVAFTWRIALRDVDALLDLDADGDGRLTWGEVDDRARDITPLARRALALAVPGTDGACTTSFGPAQWQHIDGGGFLVLAGRALCPAPVGRVQLIYRLFAGIDPSHRALVRLPGSAQPASLAPESSLAFAANSAATGEATAHSFGAMFADGVRHILSGLDHLLFLVALMLPAVVERREQRWTARADLRAALAHVAWIATAFTIAHSITLALASFGVVRVPASVIEPLIAATVLATALNNLWPVVATGVRRVRLRPDPWIRLCRGAGAAWPAGFRTGARAARLQPGRGRWAVDHRRAVLRAAGTGAPLARVSALDPRRRLGRAGAARLRVDRRASLSGRDPACLTRQTQGKRHVVGSTAPEFESARLAA